MLGEILGWKLTIDGVSSLWYAYNDDTRSPAFEYLDQLENWIYLKSAVKYRYPSWWWGNFIYKKQNGKWVDQKHKEFPSSQVALNEMEIYNEERHGKHHATKEL